MDGTRFDVHLRDQPGSFSVPSKFNHGYVFLQFFGSVFRFEMISRSGLDHKINLGLDPESAIALDADPDSVKYLDPNSVNLDPKHCLSP